MGMRTVKRNVDGTGPVIKDALCNALYCFVHQRHPRFIVVDNLLLEVMPTKALFTIHLHNNPARHSLPMLLA